MKRWIGGAAYFYQRTMKRGKAKTERTIKMAGTDWSQHMDFIQERKKYMLAQYHEDVYQTSKDGLKLHATYFPGPDTQKIVICFHGYTSDGMHDFIGLSDYYMRNGYGMLLVDERAHGKSEGTYIGFGCLDRHDALGWIQWVIQECGPQVQILLHDVSINTAIARRATLKEKKSGGTRIHSFPFRTIISEDKTFLEGIYQIRDQQNEMFRHANYDPVSYFAHRSKCYSTKPGHTYEPMALTYQPMTLKEKGLEKLGDIKYKTKWYPNGATTQAMYLTVMHRPEDNGLDFNFEHQIKAVSREKLEYLYYYLCKIMFKGVENPNMPVGDIMKLI